MESELQPVGSNFGNRYNASTPSKKLLMQPSAVLPREPIKKSSTNKVVYFEALRDSRSISVKRRELLGHSPSGTNQSKATPLEESKSKAVVSGVPLKIRKSRFMQPTDTRKVQRNSTNGRGVQNNLLYKRKSSKYLHRSPISKGSPMPN